MTLTFHLFACGCLGLGFAAQALAATEAGKEATFKLREVSAFEQDESGFQRGQAGLTQDKPFTEVKVYPKLTSAKPIYGSVRFGGEQGRPDSGRLYYFAADESQGTGKGFDRLYFDLNGDLDLGNDAILKPQSRLPDAARLRYSNIQQQALFDFLQVEFDFGPNGKRPVEILPRLTLSLYGTNEYRQMYFVRTHLYAGDIKVGGRDYSVRLGNDYAILGRLDAPASALLLTPKASRGGQIRWWGGDRLMAVHRIQGTFYTFSASPTGDQLTVRPYSGDVGTFEVGAGGRKLDTLTVSGSLEAESRAVAVGGEVEEGSPKPARSCQIPVGDYLPEFITVQFGRLQIEVSQNYHSDGKPRDRAGRPPVHGMTVRKDRPFVLDFSNKPAVMFASPARDQRIKAGETLEVSAVLTDPELDFMIRGLDDTSRKQTQDAEGKALGYSRNVSLDPKVIITRANGDKVAEGVMPFG